MSSKTVRNPPREQPGRGYNFQVTRPSPPPEGSRQDSARCSSPQGERNSTNSASRDDPGRGHTKAGPAPHAPFQPQPPQLPHHGLVPRPHAPAEAEAEACSPSPPTRPAAAGPPGHSGCSRGPAPRLGSAPSLRRSFPAHPYLAVPQRCHGRPTTPAQPSPERLRAGQKHAAEGVGPGRSRGGLGGGRGAGPVILSARRRRRSTRDADRGALLPPVALRVLCGPFRRCAAPSPRGCFES